MKKLIGIGALIVLILIFKFVGGQLGSTAAVQSVQQQAIAQNMPIEILGVKWLASLEEVKSIRPNIRQDSPETFSEDTLFQERKAEVTYFIKKNTVVMFIITFSEPASLDNFQKTQALLGKDYGAMSELTMISDEHGPRQCSMRATERFHIDHCIRNSPAGVKEQIVFYKAA